MVYRHLLVHEMFDSYRTDNYQVGVGHDLRWMYNEINSDADPWYQEVSLSRVHQKLGGKSNARRHTMQLEHGIKGMLNHALITFLFSFFFFSAPAPEGSPPIPPIPPSPPSPPNILLSPPIPPI